MRSEPLDSDSVAARTHLGKSYEEIDALGRRIQARLNERRARLEPYPAQQVSARLTQRILDLLHTDYLRGRRDGRFGPSRGRVRLGGLRIDLETAGVRAGPYVLLRSLASFLRLWCFLLVSVPAVLLRAREATPCTLILGLRQRDLLAAGTPKEFFAFCDEGRVRPLAGSPLIVLQDNVADSYRADPRLRVGRLGLLEVLRSSPSGRIGRFLREHLRAAWWYVAGTIKQGAFCLLDRDLASHGLAACLSEAGALRDVIITNTWFAEQPLWATALPGRSFRTHLVFYSMMGRAFAYHDAPTAPTHPGFRLMRADCFWVWTVGQRDLLHGLGVSGELRVCRPVVWRPRRCSGKAALGVAVFDVTPTKREFADRLGLAYNYYSAANCRKFLSDIAEAARALETRLGQSVPILLKHKRPVADVHDPGYLDLVTSLSQRGEIRLIDPDYDPYAMLEQSVAAVVMPFSSPAYIAKDMNLPAAYYDPTARLMETFERAEGIILACDTRALVEFLVAAAEARSTAKTS